MKLLHQFSDDLEALVARASPAVVGVEHGRGHGTGLFLTPDGYILTNRHVVRQSRKLTVSLSNGEELKATLVGGDSPTDLAVLRAEGSDFPTLPLADPKDVRMGQLVVAIGNPFRLEQSVSLGVVSAINRSLTLPDGTLLEGMIQTDAAINPGNSGGPLFNTAGQVIGINTMGISPVRASVGVAFAVPVNAAKRLLERAGR
jgi:serine protease Do